MTELLKNCPMCGAKARHSTPSLVRHEISCTKCTVKAHAFLEAAAYAQWNARVALASNLASTEIAEMAVTERALAQ
jgi:hypothetical protein